MKAPTRAQQRGFVLLLALFAAYVAWTLIR